MGSSLSENAISESGPDLPAARRRSAASRRGESACGARSPRRFAGRTRAGARSMPVAAPREPARGKLEARDDRIGLERIAGGKPRPDEVLGDGRPAVVEVALA